MIKKIIIPKVYIFITIALLFYSCSSTRDMRVRTTRPAYIGIDGSIQSLLLVNCAKPSQKPVLENILLGEIPANDVALSKECMQAISQTLNESNRFKTTLYNRQVNKTGTQDPIHTPLFNWSDIDLMCKDNNIDGVLSIEFFESSYKIINVTASGAPPLNTNGQPVLTATGNGNAKAVFRIYDAKKHSIVYDNLFQTNRTWTESAATYLEAVAKLTKRNDALINISYQLGNHFSRQLLPTTSWEARLMYKGKDDLTKKAKRQALINNWEDAAVTWEQAFNKASDSKTKSGIAYNLTLSYEVIGDLEKAKKWITKSYIESGNKNAWQYSKIINGLIYDNEILKKQTQE